MLSLYAVTSSFKSPDLPKTFSLMCLFWLPALFAQEYGEARTEYCILCMKDVSADAQPWLVPCRFEKATETAEFIIDETFGVPGVGTVVAGTVKKGVITASSPLLLGPHIGDGSFKPTAIKSIHYKRLPVTKVCHREFMNVQCNLIP